MASTLPGYKDAPTNPAPVGQEAKYVRLADVNGLLDHTSGWVNVKSYGAVGDGTTDDSAAIQAAIAGGTGGQVHFPAGIYRVTSTLAVPADTRLSGVNQRKSIIRKGFSGTLLTLADGAGFSTLSLEGQGATYTGRGVVMSGTAGRQSVSHARVIDFESHPIEFEPRAGSQSSWLDVEAYRTGGTTGSDKFAVSIASTSATGTTASGATASVIPLTLADTTRASGYFDGVSIQFTSGSQNGSLRVVSTTTTTGGGSWTFNLTSPLGGAPSNGDTFNIIVNTAVPRKFVQLETSGNCSIDFGLSNDTLVTTSILGDLAYSAQSRGVNVTNSRLLNQSALTIRGFNGTLTGSDINPAITLGTGLGEFTLAGNTYNSTITDSSGNGGRNRVDTVTIQYSPTLTSSGTQPTLGDGTLTGMYVRSGAIVTATIELTIGSTTNLGSGALRFSLPMPPVTSGAALHVGHAILFDTSGSTYTFAAVRALRGATYSDILLSGTSGQVTFNAPWSWAVGDLIRLTVTYAI